PAPSLIYTLSLHDALPICIEVFGITIPGYMFWCALVYAVVGSVLTRWIGRHLIPLNNQQQRFEADLRFSLIRVRENAESIALYRDRKSTRLNSSHVAISYA